MKVYLIYFNQRAGIPGEWYKKVTRDELVSFPDSQIPGPGRTVSIRSYKLLPLFFPSGFKKAIDSAEFSLLQKSLNERRFFFNSPKSKVSEI